MTSLSIKPIKPNHQGKHPPVKHPQVMMQHEFSCLIVAPKGSGKTNLICNLLLNHYKGYFHKVWVCSPTVANDDKWDVVKDTKHILVENKKKLKAMDTDGPPITKDTPKVVHGPGDLPMVEANIDKPKFDGRIPEEMFFADMDELQGPLAEQKDEMDEIRAKLTAQDKGALTKFYADRILVILDDQAGLYRGGVTNNWQINFVIKHRHYNTSLIIVTQAYKAIPKSIRTNCNALVCFEIPNKAELKVIYEEWPENMDEEEWMRVYRQATDKPFSFLYLNNHFPRGKRAFINFEHRVRLEEDKKIHTIKDKTDGSEKEQKAVTITTAASAGHGNDGDSDDTSGNKRRRHSN
jgi:hypothetical protein